MPAIAPGVAMQAERRKQSVESKAEAGEKQELWEGNSIFAAATDSTPWCESESKR